MLYSKQLVFFTVGITDPDASLTIFISSPVSIAVADFPQVNCFYDSVFVAPKGISTSKP
jgi:hypothetical protein